MSAPALHPSRFTMAKGCNRGVIWHYFDPQDGAYRWQVVRFLDGGPNVVLGTFDHAQPAVDLYAAEVDR